MNHVELDSETITKEVFKLVFNAVALNSDRFNKQCNERSMQFKTHRKAYYLLFCIDMKKNCTLSDIEQMLSEKRSTASLAVSKLYREGLINKCKPEKEDDGRKVYFKATKKGKALLDSFNRSFNQSVNDFYNNLTDENKSNFITGIVSLNKIFQDKSNFI